MLPHVPDPPAVRSSDAEARSRPSALYTTRETVLTFPCLGLSTTGESEKWPMSVASGIGEFALHRPMDARRSGDSNVNHPVVPRGGKLAAIRAEHDVGRHEG